MRPLLPLLVAVALGCKPKEEETTTVPVTTAPVVEFPLPEDIASIDFVSTFRDAVDLMVTVTAQQPWAGHSTSLDTREAGCPDFWTGQFEDGGVLVASEEGVSWNDDCATPGGLYYDGWVWWDFNVLESGDPSTLEGRTSEADRNLDGDGLVGNTDDVRFEFDGVASDSLYQVDAYGYERFVYSTTLDATITGSDIFTADSLTPNGYRSDLFMSITGGDVDTFTARGNVYMFVPQIGGRFDSVGVDMELHGPLGAAPDDCLLEPLGWIGVRDENAFWYDVVFLPRFEEDIVAEEYPNDPLSVCDGCGRLYVQGVEQEGMEICIDFSFLFDGASVQLPNADDYVLPIHAL